MHGKTSGLDGRKMFRQAAQPSGDVGPALKSAGVEGGAADAVRVGPLGAGELAPIADQRRAGDEEIAAYFERPGDAPARREPVPSGPPLDAARSPLATRLRSLEPAGRAPEAARAESFLRLIPEPRSSPLLRVFFPEAFHPHFDRGVLVANLSSVVAELSKSSRGRAVSLSDLIANFIGNVNAQSSSFDRLKESERFRSFLAEHDARGALEALDDSGLSALLDPEGERYQALRKALPELYCERGTVSSYSDAVVATSNGMAEAMLSEMPEGKALLDVLEYTELYRRRLIEENAWDSALNLDLPTLHQSDETKSLPPDAFSGKTLYAGKHELTIERLRGNGGENFVYDVNEGGGGDSAFVLKLTSPEAYVNPKGIHEGHQRLQGAGLPVVAMRHLGKYFNLVEKIEMFGSDVVRNAIVDGRNDDVLEIVDFYRNLMKQSKINVRDLRPANIGRREDGEWVITDWAFDPYMPEMGRIEKSHVAIWIIEELQLCLNKLAKEDPLRKPLFQLRAREIATIFFGELELPIEEQHHHFYPDVVPGALPQKTSGSAHRDAGGA